MKEIDKSFLGRGWAFPPVFDPLNSGVDMSEGEEDIKQSLIILISTIPGERVMQPLFGCDVHGVVFKRSNTEAIVLLKDLIASAIINFEPRIDLEEIIAAQNSEERQRIDVNVIYTVRLTNVRTNLVYPFYFIEGTDIREAHSL